MTKKADPKKVPAIVADNESAAPTVAQRRADRRRRVQTTKPHNTSLLQSAYQGLIMTGKIIGKTAALPITVPYWMVRKTLTGTLRQVRYLAVTPWLALNREWSSTPTMLLQKGISQNYTALVTYALNHRAAANEILDYEEGNTGLHIAARSGHLSLLGELLYYNADIEMKNFIGNTPLLEAVDANNLESFHYLIAKGAQVNARNSYGKTALHLAAAHEKTEIVRLLIEKHHFNTEEEDDEGNTPLLIAAQSGTVAMVQLLETFNARINARNDEGDY